MIECFNLLRQYKNKLTRQQIKTFKGQILKGDIDGFKKGLYNLLKRGDVIVACSRKGGKKK